MKISTILNRAAERHLWRGVIDEATFGPSSNRCEYSCNAVDRAISPHISVFAAMRFLVECGVPTDSMSAFDEFEEGTERQSVRYAMLKLFAKVAKEEGL